MSLIFSDPGCAQHTLYNVANLPADAQVDPSVTASGTVDLQPVGTATKPGGPETTYNEVIVVDINYHGSKTTVTASGTCSSTIPITRVFIHVSLATRIASAGGYQQIRLDTPLSAACSYDGKGSGSCVGEINRGGRIINIGGSQSTSFVAETTRWTGTLVPIKTIGGLPGIGQGNSALRLRGFFSHSLALVICGVVIGVGVVAFW